MKDVIISITVVLIIIIVTICASYYFVTKYNINKQYEGIFTNNIIMK